MFLNLLLLEAINLTLNLLACFQLLLHSDQELDTINNHLDQLNLGETETISVGNIENLNFHSLEKYAITRLTPPSAAVSTPPVPRF